ncbi:NAD(P)/FAD-dependent oxidoreductase [Saccharomonospora sp. NB11]|jgi:2-polyprenyl-6-methoxyphenol hydroxylase-like FAD-dependent oxidoreductase|uniref:FAD-dependent oxidoreductase n=1 Tax=Saccharomonospora sp. NB11 TaxID=1642298 RepID=UPI0018D12ECF|nr:NAD(P)/FAD-dependent oxidoreductase [Saccharomonospora sp. NB11]
MSSLDERTVDVVVVGGGVPALILAGQLAERSPGLVVEVLERADAGVRPARGVLVHPVTHLLLEQAGYGLPEGTRVGVVERLEEYDRGELLGEYPAGRRATDSDRVHHPYNLSLSVLAEAVEPALSRLPNCTVRYGTTVTEARSDDHGWRLRTTGPDGDSLLSCRLLVAADGKDSAFRGAGAFTVRQRGFPGRVDLFAVPQRRQRRPAISMVLAENESTTVVDNGMGPNTLLFDMRPDGSEPTTSPTIRREVVDRVRAAGLDLPAEPKPLFTMSFRSVVVQCDTWYRDRLLLLGDAAHAMHNLGGQGFNIAVQNAFALADPLSALLETGDEAPLREFERFRLPYVTNLQNSQSTFYDDLSRGAPTDRSWFRTTYLSLVGGQPGLSRFLPTMKETVDA